MKIALIGATGDTGRHFLDQSLAKGHDVTALARSPDKLADVSPKLKVVRADARDVDSLTAALSPDLDVVVSIVGAASLMEARKTTDLYSAGTRNLLEAMGRHGLKRLVVVSSGGVEPQENDNWFYVHVLKRFFLNAMYEDMIRMEDILRASELDYTIVRPPYLTKGGPTGKYRVSKGKNFADDKSLRRGDLAHFLVRAVEEGPAWARTMVAVSE